MGLFKKKVEKGMFKDELSFVKLANSVVDFKKKILKTSTKPTQKETKSLADEALKLSDGLKVFLRAKALTKKTIKMLIHM